MDIVEWTSDICPINIPRQPMRSTRNSYKFSTFSISVKCSSENILVEHEKYSKRKRDF